MKGFVVSLTAVLLLSGCELFEDRPRSAAEVKSISEEDKYNSSLKPDAESMCYLQQNNDEVTEVYHCDITRWMNYWLEHNSLSWPKRKEMIENLGDTPDELLKKVLLSQRKGTPYQNRLRAQAWADQLHKKLTDESKNLLNLAVYDPSQQMLEFESALTILTRINTNQSKEIDAQKETLKEQQQQIEQLLKIEASMMEKREGINQ